jgi:predicted ferric reductase
MFYSLLYRNGIKINNQMGNLLYIIAVILVIAWLIGFLGYAAGGLVHILLVLAVIAVLVNIIGGDRRRI